MSSIKIFLIFLCLKVASTGKIGHLSIGGANLANISAINLEKNNGKEIESNSKNGEESPDSPSTPKHLIIPPCTVCPPAPKKTRRTVSNRTSSSGENSVGNEEIGRFFDEQYRNKKLTKQLNFDDNSSENSINGETKQQQTETEQKQTKEDGGGEEAD
ncbi:hypothetical protein niasHT_029716 [Heterodera trifolii]|uniref:Uncharacterized protein n=1 Tax=Heterodera trifolii TaxID=157864 RepID=A0ABD2KBB7_9BILA